MSSLPFFGSIDAKSLRRLCLLIMALAFAVVAIAPVTTHVFRIATLGLGAGVLAAFALPEPSTKSRANWPLTIIFTAWGAVVAQTILHHEFWRDEVRALTLARQATSIWAVPATIHGEGHPALWYLLLKIAYDIFHSPLVLPLVSGVVATAAVLIFLWQAPFPFWTKPLFVFSAAPLYEYSVMARNYGISMLLMFLWATRNPRTKQSLAVSCLILFLLAQTNVLTTLLVPCFLLVWIWQAIQNGNAKFRIQSINSIAIVALTGIVAIMVAFFTVYPTHLTVVTETFSGRIPVREALFQAVLNPGWYYQDILHLPAVLITIALYLAILGLVSDLPLFLAGLMGLWTHALFFGLVYPSRYRHEAIWLVFLVVLYWVKFDRAREFRRVEPGRITQGAGFVSIVVLIILAANCLYGFRAVAEDMEREISEIKLVGQLLNSTPQLRNAIVLPEPEQIGEALPYYADNDIYLMRERKFGKIATWSRNSIAQFDLGTVLETATTLKSKTGRSIVIMMQHRLTEDGADKVINAGFHWTFTYSVAQLQAFRAATRQLASYRNGLTSLTDEDFEVYLLEETH